VRVKEINIKSYLLQPPLLNIICMIKGVLRVNIPVVEVTVGLSKSQKRYGNGRLIVADTKTRVFSNTSKVMFRKCEVIQRRGMTTFNLEVGHKKLAQNLLYHSLACTFMNKFKLNFRRQVFKEYGKTIQVQNDNGKVAFKLVKNLQRIEKFSNIVLPSGFETFKCNFNTQSVFDKLCKICGTKRNVEMHHRRPLKIHRTDNTLQGIQIPLCASFHQRVHNGFYDSLGIY